MRIEAIGFTRAVTCSSVFFESPVDRKPAVISGGDNDALPAKVADDYQCSTSSSSTSSIGRNSDLSSERSVENDDGGENEAQSAYKGPLDMMESLEEVLPIRRGISNFYDGKSKSYTSLADASSSLSVKDIMKPENSYTRRRRNLMAFNHFYEKNRNFPLRSNSGGISKRTISSSRSTLALAVAMNNSESTSTTTSDDSTSLSNSTSRSPPRLPPLHPRNRVSACSSGTRSFSLADLQNCATAATVKMSSSSLRNETALL